MKQLGVRTIIAITALSFLALATPGRAHADTVSLTFENVGPGNNSGGVYTYPYNFSVNGSTTYTSLMCYAYNDEIYAGESWQATVNPIATTQEEELAYLYSVASSSTSSAATVSAAQWAAWELFDPGLTSAPDQSAVNSELTAAASFISTANASFYDQYQLYIPVAGSQNPVSDGPPQLFIGAAAVTPEPSSLLLLGSGLLILAGAAFRKRRSAVRLSA